MIGFADSGAGAGAGAVAVGDTELGESTHDNSRTRIHHPFPSRILDSVHSHRHEHVQPQVHSTSTQISRILPVHDTDTEAADEIDIHIRLSDPRSDSDTRIQDDTSVHVEDSLSFDDDDTSSLVLGPENKWQHSTEEAEAEAEQVQEIQ